MNDFYFLDHPSFVNHNFKIILKGCAFQSLTASTVLDIRFIFIASIFIFRLCFCHSISCMYQYSELAVV